MKSIAIISRFSCKSEWLKTAKLKSRCCFSTECAEKVDTNEKWSPVIGLEIHAQISSKSKLFSGASTEFGNPVNTCVSFFDCATPGTLPVLNQKCVEAGVLTALALSCQLNEVSLFDRKHYFYPDLPSGYQITQQRQPLAVDGKLKFHVFTPGVHKKSYEKVSKIKQIQLEQDSGKSLHDKSDKRSYIDLNRAGIPLLELVFEPDLNDGEEAAALVKELILILERLNVCSCKMEEGSLRVDANISVNRPNEPLGVRTEVKNIGSVRAVAAAVKYEILRQINILENSGEIVNETRAWDVESKKTVPMRKKEEKHDYRFMPEPNLPPLRLHVCEGKENVHNLVDVPLLKKRIAELPEQTREDLLTKYKVSPDFVKVLVNEPVLLETFKDIVDEKSSRKPNFVAKVIIIDVLAFLNKHHLNWNYSFKIRDHIADLIDLLQSRQINLLILGKVLEEILLDENVSCKQIIAKNNWTLITDRKELTTICQTVINENPNLVKVYKAGKKSKQGAYRNLMRQIVETTQQKADMKLVDEIMQELLKKFL